MQCTQYKSRMLAFAAPSPTCFGSLKLREKTGADKLYSELSIWNPRQGHCTRLADTRDNGHLRFLGLRMAAHVASILNQQSNKMSSICISPGGQGGAKSRFEVESDA